MTMKEKADAYLEGQALALSHNRTRLLRRLMEARAVLMPEYKGRRKEWHINIKEKSIWRRLPDSSIALLTWKLRAFPALPPSSNNQQTSRGYVDFTVV